MQKFETAYVKTETGMEPSFLSGSNVVFYDRSAIEMAAFCKVVAIDHKCVILDAHTSEGGDIWYMLKCFLVSGVHSGNWNILVNPDFTGYMVARTFDDGILLAGDSLSDDSDFFDEYCLTFHDRDLLKMVVEDFLGGV